jgi:predicted RNA-binding Zn-ribbon protein involved in translation (DUF1610 family)
MLLNDMSEIVIQKTVMGICCPDCGGDLQPAGNGKKTGWWIWLMTRFIRKKLKHYTCSNCKKMVRVF